METAQTPQLAWSRRVFVAVVAAIGLAAFAIAILPVREKTTRLTAVLKLRPDFDWEREAPRGPLLSDGDLQSALRHLNGVTPSRDEIRRLRAALDLQVEPPRNAFARRIRLGLTTANAERGETLLRRLTEAAVLRLNVQPWLAVKRQQDVEARRELAAARELEQVAQQDLIHDVEQWLLDRDIAVRNPPPHSNVKRELANQHPRTLELQAKTQRLNVRLEELLHTHRRSHPLVARLENELNRARVELAAAPPAVAQVAAARSGSVTGQDVARQDAVAAAARLPLGPEFSPLDATQLDALERRVALGRRRLDAARAYYDEAVAARPSLADLATLEAACWVDQPPQAAPEKRNPVRQGLLMLLLVTVGLTAAAGDDYLHHRWPASESRPRLLWRVRGAVLAVLSAATALLACGAVWGLLVR